MSINETMTEDEADKKLKEAVHQLSKAICLVKIARNQIEHVVDKTDWEIDAMYDIDDALKSLAYSIANLETLDTDLAFINNY